MIFGCIADDFTGGSDIASFFVKGGLRTVLFNGVPSDQTIPEVDVCVIALKTRTQDTQEAVKVSLDAIKWLKEQGAQQFYVKYCSTFDSTPEGNIGPISDAVMEELDAPYTILCPALPVNGRTVKNGCLYVHGVPLHESSMKDHPLTPMWDYDLARIMEPQSKFTSMKLPKGLTKEEAEEFIVKVQQENASSPFYIIPDFEKEEDAEQIVQLFGNLILLTGGSGLAEPLAKMYQQNVETDEFGRSNSKVILLSGSCSETTRKQIEAYSQSGGESYFIDPMKLLSGEESVEKIWNVIKNTDESILVYSSDTPENVKLIQEQGKEEVAELLEKTTAELAALAAEAGYHRIIVAGGETSGAVTKRLGFTSYHIGESIAPGVPIMIPTQDTSIRLVLKSGNFGDTDFFLQALSRT
ncbi:four-carbon acid sugar kinase family protein [Sporosarcina thermotolerans]|uniref:3-oxo-tetronate kinase n=1 Tax=Sporosarcina thermotolerans TaxID=633404 RepID=A0AAW9AAI7_9BACL|nr:3-oxo-tetronate kinase [Sporosarcina thermotolerans]MDW0116201.1 four-carbon acid sugar kinase family protein [Sporosarcina thermotolerans]WHT48177.1 four-carbon acid sugar kinase family protein [Sporosarcina thermotolerans]